MIFTLLIAMVNSQTRSYLTCYHFTQISFPSFLKDFIYLASDHHCLLLFLPGWCFLIFSTFKCCNYAELSHQTSHLFILQMALNTIYTLIIPVFRSPSWTLPLSSRVFIQLATQTLHSSVWYLNTSKIGISPGRKPLPLRSSGVFPISGETSSFQVLRPNTWFFINCFVSPTPYTQTCIKSCRLSLPGVSRIWPFITTFPVTTRIPTTVISGLDSFIYFPTNLARSN